MLATFLSLSLLALPEAGLAQQSPAKPAPAQPAPATPANAAAAPVQKAVTAWDDKTAKAAVDQLAKALKGSPSLAARTQALEQLATGASALLVKPLVRIVETEKSVVVQRRALELLANQPTATANPALLKLMKATAVASRPAVLAELLRTLARCGYEQQQWAAVEPFFEESYHPDCVPVHTAILDLARTHKEARAVPLLLRNLDEPVPTDVDAQHNPPAEYWKERWQAWSTWREQVKDALFAITGQRFNSAAEAQAWLAKNPVSKSDGKGKGDKSPGR